MPAGNQQYRTGEDPEIGDLVSHYVDSDTGEIVNFIDISSGVHAGKTVVTVNWERGGHGCEHYADECTLIDRLETGWTRVWLKREPGEGRTFVKVPVTGRNHRLDAALTPIPGALVKGEIFRPDSEFFQHALAYATQDGNLRVDGSRYGRWTDEVFPAALACALIAAYHQGEALTYYALDHSIGLAVNDSSELRSDLKENRYVLDEFGIDIDNLIDGDD